MSNQTTQPIVFLDNIGRTIIAKTVTETDSTLVVRNPALVHVQPNPGTNQLQLQLLPLFFKEFLSDSNENSDWTFNKTSITKASALELVPQFVAQYEQLFPPSRPKGEPEVIKLFED